MGVIHHVTTIFFKTYGEKTLRSPYKDYSSLTKWQANWELLTPPSRGHRGSLELPLHWNTAVPSWHCRPVIAPPPRCVPVGPVVPSSYVGCPRRLPYTSSPGWMSSAVPSQRRAQGHRAVTTGGARTPRRAWACQTEWLLGRARRVVRPWWPAAAVGRHAQ
jgi:hypothetical protein